MNLVQYEWESVCSYSFDLLESTELVGGIYTGWCWEKDPVWLVSDWSKDVFLFSYWSDFFFGKKQKGHLRLIGVSLQFSLQFSSQFNNNLN